MDENSDNTFGKRALNCVLSILPDSCFNTGKQNGGSENPQTPSQPTADNDGSNAKSQAEKEESTKNFIENLSKLIFSMKDGGEALKRFVMTLNAISQTGGNLNYALALSAFEVNNPETSPDMLLSYLNAAKEKVQQSAESFAKQCDDDAQKLRVQRESEIKDLNHAISKKTEEISALQGQLNSANAALNELQAELNKLTTTSDPQIEAINQDKQSGAAAVNQVLAGIEQHVREITASMGGSKQQ